MSTPSGSRGQLQLFSLPAPGIEHRLLAWEESALNTGPPRPPKFSFKFPLLPFPLVEE